MRKVRTIPNRTKKSISLKSFSFAAGSPTTTLLRLLTPVKGLYRHSGPPFRVKNDGFGHFRFPGCDGRCVQDPGTSFTRYMLITRLPATPTSRRRGCSLRSGPGDKALEICSELTTLPLLIVTHHCNTV